MAGHCKGESESNRFCRQSSSVESLPTSYYPTRLGELELIKKAEKGTEAQQKLSIGSEVQRKSSSFTISRLSQQQHLLRCSVAALPPPESNTQVNLKKNLLLLKKRRALFRHRERQSVRLNSDSISDSSPDNSGETVVAVGSQKNNCGDSRKPARHISVRKFDTFSTFEGTFDEDTGLGYLDGLEENRTESCENADMLANSSQDSTTTKNNTGNPTSIEKKEHLYKILVIGELGAGKTSIIKRYVHQFFSQHYRATIGVDFALKVLNWDPQTIIRLQLWDIAGQERFGNMTRVYYKEAVGAFIVFDVTRSSTLDAVVKWKNDLDSKVQLSDGSPIPCVLLANKCDQQKEGFTNFTTKMDEYCKEKNFIGWFETSAKENINIEEAARFLINKILQNEIIKGNNTQEELDSESFVINQYSENSKKPCSC